MILSLMSSTCNLANIHSMYNISITIQLIQLSIATFVFEMAQLRTVQMCYEVRNAYFHYKFLKLKISAIIPTLETFNA